MDRAEVPYSNPPQQRSRLAIIRKAYCVYLFGSLSATAVYCLFICRALGDITTLEQMTDALVRWDYLGFLVLLGASCFMYFMVMVKIEELTSGPASRPMYDYVSSWLIFRLAVCLGCFILGSLFARLQWNQPVLFAMAFFYMEYQLFSLFGRSAIKNNCMEKQVMWKQEPIIWIPFSPNKQTKNETNDTNHADGDSDFHGAQVVQLPAAQDAQVQGVSKGNQTADRQVRERNPGE